MTRYGPLEASRIAFAGMPAILCAIMVVWLGGCGGGGDAEAPGTPSGESGDGAGAIPYPDMSRYGIIVEDIAFSPNGKLLAAEESGNVKLWDVETGLQVGQTLRLSQLIDSLAFSPDGQVLATAGEEDVHLWNVPGGEKIGTLSRHPGKITQVTFSPDGKLLATAGWDGNIKVWDRATQREMQTLSGHTDSVLCVAFSPDGALIASAGIDKTGLRLWDQTSGRQLWAASAPEQFNPSALGFSPEGEIVVLVYRDASARLAVAMWSSSSGQEVATIRGPTWDGTAAALSSGSAMLATGDLSKVIKVWETASLKVIRELTLAGDVEDMRTLALSGDGTVLAIGGKGGTELWDLRSGQSIKTLREK